jgi:ACS family D-galactonate transporter-like MFS transporter
MKQTTQSFLERPTRVRWKILGLLVAFSFMSWLNRTSMAVAYDLRIKQQFAISEVQIGSVYTALFLAYTVLMTPGGWFADRLGARRALLLVGFGSGVFAALTGYLGFLTSAESFSTLSVAATASFAVTYLLVVRFLMGACMAPIYPASTRAVGHWMPPDGRASANGLIMGAALVGNASSFLLLGEMIDWLDWPSALIITGYVTAAVAVLWALEATDNPSAHPRANQAEQELVDGTATSKLTPASGPLDVVPAMNADGWRALFANRSLWLLTVSYAAVGYFEYLFFFWMHYYFDNVLHVGSQPSRIYTCIVFLAMAGGMVLGGRLSDALQRRYGRRWGRLTVAGGGMLAGAVLLLCGLYATQPAWIVAWFALALGSVGASEGPFWTTAVELGGRRGGTAAGIFNTGGNVGGLLAPIVTPLVHAYLPKAWDDNLRWKLAISIGGVVCVFGAALWWAIYPTAQGEPGASETSYRPKR